MRAQLRGLFFILAGPGLLGAATGLEYGPVATLSRAIAMPTIIVGITLLMLPALYVGSSLVGAAPQLIPMLRSTHRALQEAGMVFVGFALPLAFLVAATTHHLSAELMGFAVTALGIMLGLRSLFHQLFSPLPDSNRHRSGLTDKGLTDMGRADMGRADTGLTDTGLMDSGPDSTLADTEAATRPQNIVGTAREIVPAMALPLFAIWSTVSLGIGLRVYIKAMQYLI